MQRLVAAAQGQVRRLELTCGTRRGSSAPARRRDCCQARETRGGPREGPDLGWEAGKVARRLGPGRDADVDDRQEIGRRELVDDLSATVAVGAAG